MNNLEESWGSIIEELKENTRKLEWILERSIANLDKYDKNIAENNKRYSELENKNV